MPTTRVNHQHVPENVEQVVRVPGLHLLNNLMAPLRIRPAAGNWEPVCKSQDDKPQGPDIRGSRVFPWRSVFQGFRGEICGCPNGSQTGGFGETKVRQFDPKRRMVVTGLVMLNENVAGVDTLMHQWFWSAMKV